MSTTPGEQCYYYCEARRQLGNESCPPQEEWPPELKKYLWHRYFTEMLCFGDETADAGWQRILLACYRGKVVEVGGERKLIPWATTLTEVYPIALAECKGGKTDV